MVSGAPAVFANHPIDDPITVDGFVKDPLTGVVEPAYTIDGITYTQDQATGEFAGLLDTAEDATTLYFAFEQSVFINYNTYGPLSDTGGSIGWSKDHKLKDLIQSEHIQFILTNDAGDPVYDFFID